MQTPAPPRRSPYQGLIPYAEEDAPFFFGRDRDTRLIVANLFASPLTLLYGMSGVGKSSVLRAGAVNRLRGDEGVFVLFFNTWQGDALNDLKAALTKAVFAQATFAPARGRSAFAVAGGLRRFTPFRAPLADYLAAWAARLGRRLMVILDQFEEYFLYHPQEDDFAEEFARAVVRPNAPVNFLVSVREDALAKLDRFEGRIPTLFDNYLRVEHLDRKAARAAIENPIRLYNTTLPSGEPPYSIEPALVEAVLEQVQTGQVVLGEAGRGVVKSEGDARVETPFLQMVMTRLWDEETRAGSRVLRLETLERLADADKRESGAVRIVRTHLDETMGSLPPDKQGIAAEVFHYLVTPSGTKIAHTVPDLAEYAEVPQQQLRPALEELAHGDVRILRPVTPPHDQPREPRYEIFHDVLAPAVLDWRSRYVQAEERAENERKLALEEQERRKAQQQLEREQRMVARQRRYLALLALLLIAMLAATA
ncbi:MAG TPA: ATP-binding protein, partial [Pyrinomonadaceae bacterium]|nr:ATP-binding protein [Pyrinomonadaceae bacterium]